MLFVRCAPESHQWCFCDALVTGLPDTQGCYALVTLYRCQRCGVVTELAGAWQPSTRRLYDPQVTLYGLGGTYETQAV